jgi:hypothetical protein
VIARAVNTVTAAGTDGQTFGHNAAGSAFTVAAVDVATGGGGVFVGGATNPVEPFTSDGPRRIFYDPAGNATLSETAIRSMTSSSAPTAGQFNCARSAPGRATAASTP